MYSALTQLALDSLPFTLGAPVPKDNATRDTWREQHKFEKKLPNEEPRTLLPGEAYFLTSTWSPFNKVGTGELQDKATLAKNLMAGNYNDYIVRDSKNRIIATTEDFKNRMVLNLDKPHSGFRLGEKGIEFGEGVTVENLRTGEVTKNGLIPYPPGADFKIDLNAHSAGYGIDVAHTDRSHRVRLDVVSGGPANLSFREKAAGAHITIKNDKPEELKEAHHRIELPPSVARQVDVCDCECDEKFERGFLFGKPADATGIPAGVTVETRTFRGYDDSATHSVDFVVVDTVRFQDVTSAKTSYTIGTKPSSSSEDFSKALAEQAAATAKKADILRQQYDEKIEAPKLPAIPMQRQGNGR